MVSLQGTTAIIFGSLDEKDTTFDQIFLAKIIMDCIRGRHRSAVSSLCDDRYFKEIQCIGKGAKKRVDSKQPRISL